jgi:uncharacterized protein (TIGR03067 family)
LNRKDVVAAERDGKPEDCSGLTVTFADSKVILERNGKKSKPVGFKVDPAKTPKHIDFEERQPPTKGIYEVKEKQMRLCYGIDRPKEFGSASALLLVLKREKP